MRCRYAVIPLLLTCWLAGCGGGGGSSDHHVVTGKIVKGGAPLKVEGLEFGAGRIEVRLVPLFEGAEEESALATADGSFRFVGKGDGIRSGQYKIAVYAIETANQPAPGSTGEVDILKGQFSRENTPLQRDISADTADLGTIDLDNAAQR